MTFKGLQMFMGTFKGLQMFMGSYADMLECFFFGLSLHLCMQMVNALTRLCMNRHSTYSTIS